MRIRLVVRLEVVIQMSQHLIAVHCQAMILQGLFMAVGVWNGYAKTSMAWLTWFCWVIALGSDMFWYAWPAPPMAVIGSIHIPTQLTILWFNFVLER